MTDQKIRLHITPFSPDFLSAILPFSASHLAENISYHTIQTFPENNYGFLELPAMEADKIKKKLNGSILKGKHIRIEDARPRKRPLRDDTEGREKELAGEPSHGVQRVKRVKQDSSTVTGHELSPNRKVKRGWTEPKKGKERKPAKERRSSKSRADQAPSKYTNKEELLFRTKLPANKAKAIKEKSKKDKSSRDVLVHEFEKSTVQPSFLREGASDSKKATEYVDGRGWIDEKGDVVEEEVSKPRKTGKPAIANISRSQTKKRIQRSPSPENSASNSSASGAEDDDETSSSGTSSDDESDMTVTSSHANISKATSIEEPQPEQSSTTSVHPLEAIFKRPTKAASDDIAKPSLEVETSFSFFEPNADTTFVPLTPFNSQDLRSRELRSAAPTPDTAAPSRFNSWGSSRNGADSTDDADAEDTAHQPRDETPSRAVSQGKKHEDSEFSSFFWESRGANNRTWKKRKREANKEKRQRENRQRGRKF